MKEYKLSAKSIYSVLYLLCGLFMFFFIFAILNLSSYASQDGSSAFPYYVIDRYNTDNYTEMFPGGTNYTSLTQNTNIDKYYHLVGRVNVVPDSLTNTDEEFSIVLNTSDGSFNIYSSSATPSMGSTIFNFDIYFKGKYSSLVRYEKEHVGGVGSQYSFYSYTVFIDSCTEVSSSSSSFFNFSDYSSYSPVNSLDSINVLDGSVLPAGSAISISCNDFSTNRFLPSTNFIPFSTYGYKSYMAVCVLTVPYYTTLPTIQCIVRESTTDIFNSTSPSVYLLTEGANYLTYAYVFNFNLGVFNETHFYKITAFNIDVGYSLVNQSFTLLECKNTISDYMQYVKNNWNDLSPAVTDTNQNIAQSVSDIGTAQTFETGAFTDFDTSMTSSGLDTFSLSFASAPLLWCASIINTFYNNMPSGFQYLLMFVAFVGILVIVLNIAGRVVRRFGGD